jgi:hypothetical protein
LGREGGNAHPGGSKDILGQSREITRFNLKVFPTSKRLYAYKHIQSMYPKVGLEEETKGGGKEGKKNSKG